MLADVLAAARAGAPRAGKILALSTQCQSEDEDVCNLGHQLAVDAEVRMTLEFVGHRIIDSETANVHVERHDARTPAAVPEHGAPAPADDTARAPADEIGADDATAPDGRILWTREAVAQHRHLLQDMGIDGFMHSLITVGHSKNLEDQRTVSVSIAISRVADGALVWRSRCLVETGRFYTLDQAVERGARCALDAATTVDIP